MESVASAIIGGLFALLCVVATNRLRHRDDATNQQRQDDRSMTEIKTTLRAIGESQKELWDVTDGVRGDIAYIAGKLSIELPGRR